MTDKPKVLVCFSGSVASIKIPELVLGLLSFSDVRLVSSSKAAEHFLQRASKYNPDVWNYFTEYNCQSLIINDAEEWNAWNVVGDPVLHIELRKWADAIVVVPASADIIAKISIGISDSLLLSILRAWDFSKPCIICPAMNSIMWSHPITALSLSTLKKWGCIIVEPVVKKLACNDTGNGALAKIPDIIEKIKDVLATIKNYSDYPLPDYLRQKKIISKNKLHLYILTEIGITLIYGLFAGLFVFVVFQLFLRVHY